MMKTYEESLLQFWYSATSESHDRWLEKYNKLVPREPGELILCLKEADLDENL